ncbi:vicilin-like seed storage protein At2g18540 [Aplysia californica]|uniref:Vicilin-like seed storage protein At2g18540 n=1 Tax=Aplysia californica TaxID=6500 RepID=A0ABM1AA20_APLCA|nr:vicilin-like seed storage protein At2g18540 [Aplysia californica]
MEVGDKILAATRVDDHEDREKAIQEAVEKAEERATRELRAALRRLRQEKEEERTRALDKQKWYFERLAARISEQRDRAEAERMKELRNKLEQEKEEALQNQWEECERLKEIAIEEACAALHKRLRNEFAVEREQAVAEALKKAREAFKKREQEVIERTRRECEEKARQEAERVAALHKAEVDGLNLRYDILDRKYRKELAHKERLERDFRGLQDDYKRFMDYTDGRFHSDYLMRLRHLGMRLAEKQISTVTYEDIEPLTTLPHICTTTAGHSYTKEAIQYTEFLCSKNHCQQHYYCNNDQSPQLI